MTDIQTLKKAAEAATPGPYKTRGGTGSHGPMFVQAPRRKPEHPYDIELLGEDTHEELYPVEQKEADCRYVAMLDPATVLELCRLAEIGREYEDGMKSLFDPGAHE